LYIKDLVFSVYFWFTSKRILMKKTIIILLLCCPLFLFGQKSSQDTLSSEDLISPSEKVSLFDHFSTLATNQENQILNITIKSNFDSLVTNKKKMKGFIPGKVYFQDEKNDTISLKSNLRIRGKFRRLTCDFPPLRIKIKKKKLRKLGLNDEFNSFKLVTHCLDDKKKSKEYVLKEYLLYKIYNHHTDYSLRAQLVKVTYVQSGSDKKIFERYGILLEGDDELATRSDAIVVEKFSLSPDSLDTFGGSVHALFQCMIGNADYGVRILRNAKVMRVNGQEKLNIFPYDFDFSGFVNAEYAIPNPDYKLTSTKQRIFLGKIYSDEMMETVRQHFLDRKETTLTMCKNFTLLPKKCRKKSIKFLKSFYKKIENEKEFINELRKLCPKN